MNLKTEACLIFIVLVLTAGFVLFPGPRMMATFTFIAQPLFLLVAIKYFIKVFKDLRDKDVM